MTLPIGQQKRSGLAPGIIFITLTAIYACLALHGIGALSANGAIMDSDLQTYAQGMAGADNPALFANDPVLRTASAANSIPNLERILAGWLAPPGHYVQGLARAGSLAIFFFYAGWYILGAFLYKSPVMAAVLAITEGITIWVGWGTFWGITHSDPVPRVFYAAILPFLLLFAIKAAPHLRWRPLVMFCAGLTMWIHGVSALNCGAMLFLAFAFTWPTQKPWRARFLNLFICALAFLIPALIFLWPSLAPGKHFTPEELEIFREVFELRWQNDYGDFGRRLLNFLNPASAIPWILATAFPAWLILKRKGNTGEKTLAAMYPGLVLAPLVVAAFSLAETALAPSLGRVPMGHELVRGLRFLIPVSWLLIGGAIDRLAGKWSKRALLGMLAAGVLLFNADRQHAAVRLSLGELGAPVPLQTLKDAQKARESADMLGTIANIVPEGEAVFSNGEDMAIRYLAKRPLPHTFKDGYIHFYNKDPSGALRWLEYEKTIRGNPDGYIDAWIESGSPWLLSHNPGDLPRLEKLGTLSARGTDWLLIHRK